MAIEQGTIIQFLPLENGLSKAGKAWQRQTYILETDDKYPRKIALEAWGDRVNTCSMSVGEMVEVHFDIESSPYNDKWYTRCTLYKIERVGMVRALPRQGAGQPEQFGQAMQGYGQGAGTGGQGVQAPAKNDLPF